MRQRGTSMSRLSVALVAVWMLALQGLLVAFATAAGHPGESLDGFGNPLCITSTDAHGLGDDAHTGLPSCCFGVCGPVNALSHDGRAPHELENPLVLSLDRVQPQRFESLRPATTHEAARPRAPPPTA